MRVIAADVTAGPRACMTNAAAYVVHMQCTSTLPRRQDFEISHVKLSAANKAAIRSEGLMLG